MNTNATPEAINQVMEEAWQAFHIFRNQSLKQRAELMRKIALEIENLGDLLLQTAMAETNLQEARLRIERTRTIFQLTSYAAHCKSGQWLDARIDHADVNRAPAKPDIRKMLIPLGPVVVFGASNFPFAYSTAGGDTACALAAGCPVIVKVHPAHPETSELVAGAIIKAVASKGLPKGVFAHVHGASSAVGEALVKHPHTKAVGFTGSFAGGKQLFDWGNQRKEPIPVFAEMGSVNPVFLLPEKLKLSAVEMAQQLAASINLSAGQFCTNPGIMIGIKGESLDIFLSELSELIKKTNPASMLHDGIHKNYVEKRSKALSTRQVSVNAVADMEAGSNEGLPTIATCSAQTFLDNPLLQEEVFGPYSLLVCCDDADEMMMIARCLVGQLTATVMASEIDVAQHRTLIEQVKNICGRFIFNGVPTGVEVCLSMQHGGPFPATTDSRFTAVGADGIRRFARPMAFQNWPDALLPEELQESNPLNIWRTINNEPGRS